MTDPDLDLLADLDAGLLPPERAARVRAAAQADPRSAAVLDALAATRAELGSLGDPPVPAHVSAQWAAALDHAALVDAAPDHAAPGHAAPGHAAPGHAAPVDATPVDAAPVDAAPVQNAAVEVTPLPRRRGVRRRVLGSLVAAAAVVAGVLLVRADDPLAVTRVELAAVARSTVGLDDLGELTDPERRAGCLAAVGSPDAEVAGGRRVSLDGEPGVLLVLTTGVRGRFQVLVVDPGCRSVLDEVVIGP